MKYSCIRGGKGEDPRATPDSNRRRTEIPICSGYRASIPDYSTRPHQISLATEDDVPVEKPDSRILAVRYLKQDPIRRLKAKYGNEVGYISADKDGNIFFEVGGIRDQLTDSDKWRWSLEQKIPNEKLLLNNIQAQTTLAVEGTLQIPHLRTTYNFTSKFPTPPVWSAVYRRQCRDVVIDCLNLLLDEAMKRGLHKVRLLAEGSIFVKDRLRNTILDMDQLTLQLKEIGIMPYIISESKDGSFYRVVFGKEIEM